MSEDSISCDSPLEAIKPYRQETYKNNYEEATHQPSDSTVKDQQVEILGQNTNKLQNDNNYSSTNQTKHILEEKTFRFRIEICQVIVIQSNANYNANEKTQNFTNCKFD